jgi:hypothetical protein
MKVFTTILLTFLGLSMFGQNVCSYNTGLKVSTAGRLYFTPCENYWAFKDSAVTVAGGTNVQITNAADSLWRNIIELGITRLDGDTMQITCAGVYDIYIGFGGSGANGADWSVQVAQKRAGVTTYSNSEILMTTTGAGNKVWGFSMFRRDALVGDKYWFVLTRLAGTGDFTGNSGTMKCQMYYAK